LAVIGRNLPLAPFIMRPQSRPFVVEIKRSKKLPASPADPVEAARPKVGLFDNLPRSGDSASAARLAAEKLFGAVAKPPEPVVAATAEPAFADADGSAGPASASGRRVWFAPDPVPVPVAAVGQLELDAPAPAKPERERRPRGRPKAVPALLAQPSMLETPLPPVPEPLVEAEDDDLVLEVAVADAPRRSGPRLGGRRKDELRLGERWKRRLPSVCR
jgi:hypothetical protein